MKEESVLVDHRTYLIKPGKMQAYLDLYEKHGFPAQVRHLGKPMAYMVTESGEMNSTVHIWVYEDAADRAKRRAGMMADPDWQNYLKLSGEAGYIEKQTTKLMTPAKFAPLSKPA
jgi:hypothetical protein